MRKILAVTSGPIGTTPNGSDADLLGRRIIEELLSKRTVIWKISKILYLCPNGDIYAPSVPDACSGIVEPIIVNDIDDLHLELDRLMKDTKIDVFIHAARTDDVKTKYAISVDDMACEIQHAVFKHGAMLSRNQIAAILRNPDCAKDGSPDHDEHDTLTLTVPIPDVVSLARNMSPDMKIVSVHHSDRMNYDTRNDAVMTDLEHGADCAVIGDGFASNLVRHGDKKMSMASYGRITKAAIYAALD